MGIFKYRTPCAMGVSSQSVKGVSRQSVKGVSSQYAMGVSSQSVKAGSLSPRIS